MDTVNQKICWIMLAVLMVTSCLTNEAALFSEEDDDGLKNDIDKRAIVNFAHSCGAGDTCFNLAHPGSYGPGSPYYPPNFRRYSGDYYPDPAAYYDDLGIILAHYGIGNYSKPNLPSNIPLPAVVKMFGNRNPSGCCCHGGFYANRCACGNLGRLAYLIFAVTRDTGNFRTFRNMVDNDAYSRAGFSSPCL